MPGNGPHHANRTTARGIDAPNMLELLVRARPAIEAVVVFQVTRLVAEASLSVASGCHPISE